jgi:hypothetical protein
MTVTTGRELPIAPGDTVVIRTAWGARAYVEDIDRVRGSVRVRCADGVTLRARIEDVARVGEVWS